MFIPDPGSGLFTHPGSRGQKGTGSGSATLLKSNISPFLSLARDVFITITGRLEGIKQAQYIMSNIVKSNMHRLNLTAAIAKKEPEKKEEEKKEIDMKIGC